MLTSLILLAQAAAATPAAVPAPAAPPAATAAVAAPDEDDNRIRCKYKDQLGTRLNKVKTCMTVGQWKAYYRNDMAQFKRDITSGFAFSPSR